MRAPIFKNLLVPKDGSARARRAAHLAAQLARRSGARLTALHVVREAVPTAFSGAALYVSPELAPQYRAMLRVAAERALDAIADESNKAGVPCSRVRAQARHPWQAILRTARSRGCDLIVMGSHGRGPAAAALLGSETTQVLAHSKIPVLVCR